MTDLEDREDRVCTVEGDEVAVVWFHLDCSKTFGTISHEICSGELGI